MFKITVEKFEKLLRKFTFSFNAVNTIWKIKFILRSFYLKIS